MVAQTLHLFYNWIHSIRLAFLFILCGLFGYLLILAIQFAAAVFFNPCTQAIEAKISTTCSKGTCKVLQLDPGRYHIRSDSSLSNEKLLIQFSHAKDAKFLMIQSGSHLGISVPHNKSIQIQGTSFPRQFIPLPPDSDTLTIAIENLDPTSAKWVINEIGLCKDMPKVLGKKQKHYKVHFFWKFFLISFLGILIFAFLDKKCASTYGPVYFFIFPLAVQLSTLFLSFSPEWGRDLRAYLISGPLAEGPGCNLNYGLYMASSILQGNGPLICGQLPWCRMPGYGFIVALCGNASDLLQMGVNAIALHILLFSLSLAFFFWSALRITSPLIACAIATAISFLPENLFLTQIESIMPTVILIGTAAACLFCEQYNKTKLVPLRYHLFLHFSFALWFFIRTDVLPAWAIVSLLLYGKSLRLWKYFFIPLSFALTIGIPWALFKLPFIGELSMTTQSVGASMMVGLWDIPHKFIWLSDSDEAYFSWSNCVGLSPTTKTCSHFAVWEVCRFCLTYPIYFFSLILHKFLFFTKNCLATTLFSAPWKGLYLLTPLILSLSINYKRFQMFLLGWPVFLNIPIFFLFYFSSGRFFAAPTISLLIASFLLLLDPNFYRKIIAAPRRTLTVLIAIGSVIWFGPPLDDYLIQHDEIRYWAPFLDPAKSTLAKNAS